jgi:Tol biopolymer transport system component
MPAPEIAYQWLVSGGGDGIWVTDTGSAQSRELFADLPGEQRHPEWSPDGNYIAFIESDAGHDDVWLSRADGSNPVPLATCEGSCLGFDFVAWTPNGENLLAMAYVGPPTPNGPPESSSLSIIDVSDGSVAEIIRSDPGTLFSTVHLSPDGASYCVTLGMGDVGAGVTASAIGIGDISGGPVTTITEPSEFGAYCDWSPNGDRIVFTTYDLAEFPATDQASNLFTVAPNGRGLTPLTNYTDGTTRATQPHWSPDGSLILYTKVTTRSRVLAAIGPEGESVPLDAALGMPGTHPIQRPGSAPE